jgi:hypothetical protein
MVVSARPRYESIRGENSRQARKLPYLPQQGNMRGKAWGKKRAGISLKGEASDH